MRVHVFLHAQSGVEQEIVDKIYASLPDHAGEIQGEVDHVYGDLSIIFTVNIPDLPDGATMAFLAEIYKVLCAIPGVFSVRMYIAARELFGPRHTVHGPLSNEEWDLATKPPV